MSEDIDAVEKKGNVASIINRLSKELHSKSVAPPDPVIRRGATDIKARRAKAMFSYTPEHEDELRLEQNDVIEVLEEVEEGWWRGRLNGKIGVFPTNFVKVVEAASEAAARNSGGNKSDDEGKDSSNAILPKKPHGVGFGNIFDNNPKITLRSTNNREGQQTNSRTIEAVNNNKENSQPTASTAAGPSAAQVSPHSSAKNEIKPEEFAKVLYSYDAENDDELSLEVGDIVTVLNKKCEDPGWWIGEINGKSGLFPDNFVKPIPVEEARKQGSATPPAVPAKPKHFPSGSGGTSFSANSSSSTPPPDLPPHSGKSDVQQSTMQHNKASTDNFSFPSHGSSSSAKPPKLPFTATSVTASVMAAAAANDLKDKVRNDRPPTPDKSDVKDRMTTSVTASNTSSSSSTTTAKKPMGGFALPGLSGKLPFGSSTKSTGDEKDVQKSSADTDIKSTEADKLASLSDSLANEKLSHPTALRPKNPNRRPPSQVFLQSLGKDVGPEAESGQVPPSLPSKGTVKSSSTDAVDGKFAAGIISTNSSASAGVGSANCEFVSRAEYDRLKSEFESFKLEANEKIKDLEQKLTKLSTSRN